jgi:hypothetical protein
MGTASRPATPDQIRLLVGLSCLPILPMIAVAMLYFTGLHAASDHAPAWRAFAIALAIGAAYGLVLVRVIPVFGGTLPNITSVRTALTLGPVAALFVVVVIGRLVQQAIPVTTGFIGGVDAVLAILLLMRSFRAFSQAATPPR